jgi:hypothetical protein
LIAEVTVGVPNNLKIIMKYPLFSKGIYYDAVYMVEIGYSGFCTNPAYSKHPLTESFLLLQYFSAIA